MNAREVGLRAVTVLYGDTASVYGIRTEAVSTLGDTVHYGRRRPYLYGSATRHECTFLRPVCSL